MGGGGPILADQPAPRSRERTARPVPVGGGGLMATALTLWDIPDGYDRITRAEANALLASRHYLGPARRGTYVFGQFVAGELVACQIWNGNPSARHLPQDGSWLELSRWCLTPAAGTNAGSRMHKWARRWLLDHVDSATTLVSYSDPSQGHTGALYRACNWTWSPTWHRLRPPPSGNGSWTAGMPQSVKDRWTFNLRPDASRAEVLRVKGRSITLAMAG